MTNTYANRMRVALALQQPTGVWTNGFAYDPAKRLTNVAMSAGSFDYQYSATQQRLVSRITLPNTSVITNGYDSVARLLNTTLNNSSGTPLDSYTYVYDPANERTNVTRTDASTVGFKYDPIGQLAVADSSVNAEDRGYFYDAAWNLNRRTNNGVTSTFSVESRNELTNAAGSTITYDFNGNISGHDGAHYVYAYDDENRLTHWIHYQVSGASPTSGDKQTVFVYDGRGRLRQRYEYTMNCPIGGGGGGTGANGQPGQGGQTDSGGGSCDWALDSITAYIYDGNRVIQERDISNIPQVTYTRGTDLSGTFEGAGGIGGLLARSVGYSGGTGNWSTHHFYHADGNGNITKMVDGTQSSVASYRYDPFGNLISSSGVAASANVYRFSSKEFHVVSGMYYYLYRFYDPNLQRWINRDPLEEDGGYNLFCFVHNCPVSGIDPLGDQSNTVPHLVLPPSIVPWPPANPFPSHPASADKDKGIQNTSGNAPPAYTRPPSPCSPIGATTPNVPDGTAQVQCHCGGVQTINCTRHRECVFYGIGLNGQPVGNWQPVRSCPCPEGGPQTIL